MTQTAPETDPISPTPESTRPTLRPSELKLAERAVNAVRDVCPYLLSGDGAWRSASPSRDHACAAVGAAPLALDKQRRLCLTDTHRGCPAYAIASGEDPSGIELDTARRLVGRPYPRTAPVALDHGRLAPAVPAIRADRTAAQYILAGLMGVAFLAIAIARLSGDDGSGLTAAGTTTESPRAAVVATVVPSVAPDGSAGPLASATPELSAAPTPTPAPAASPTPVPSAALRTYKIKSGDTLSEVAARFGTTVRAIRRLNDIDDPSRLRIGTVLKLPPEE